MLGICTVHIIGHSQISSIQHYNIFPTPDILELLQYTNFFKSFSPNKVRNSSIGDLCSSKLIHAAFEPLKSYMTSSYSSFYRIHRMGYVLNPIVWISVQLIYRITWTIDSMWVLQLLKKILCGLFRSHIENSCGFFSF